ncbi:hypothetical protein YC2023_121742 [Brassica napus]
MPLEYTPLSQLNASQKEWKIRVLVSWVWNYYSKNKPEVVLGMEAILVDEKGERIQASVKQKLIKKFGRDLKEGEYLDTYWVKLLAWVKSLRGSMQDIQQNFWIFNYEI